MDKVQRIVLLGEPKVASQRNISLAIFFHFSISRQRIFQEFQFSRLNSSLRNFGKSRLHEVKLRCSVIFRELISCHVLLVRKFLAQRQVQFMYYDNK